MPKRLLCLSFRTESSGALTNAASMGSGVLDGVHMTGKTRPVEREPCARAHGKKFQKARNDHW